MTRIVFKFIKVPEGTLDFFFVFCQTPAMNKCSCVQMRLKINTYLSFIGVTLWHLMFPPAKATTYSFSSSRTKNTSVICRRHEWQNHFLLLFHCISLRAALTSFSLQRRKKNRSKHVFHSTLTTKRQKKPHNSSSPPHNQNLLILQFKDINSNIFLHYTFRQKGKFGALNVRRSHFGPDYMLSPHCGIQRYCNNTYFVIQPD